MNAEDSESKSISQQEIITAYIESLSPLAKKGLQIAQEHLESSFSLEKSIGFIAFQKQYKERNQ